MDLERAGLLRRATASGALTLAFLLANFGVAQAGFKVRLDQRFGQDGATTVYTGIGPNTQLALDRRGGILFSSGEYLVRLRGGGGIDSSFGHQGETSLPPRVATISVAGEIVVDKNDRVLMARSIYKGDKVAGEVMRLSQDGKIEWTFGQHGAIHLGRYWYGNNTRAATVGVNHFQQIFVGGNAIENGNPELGLFAKLTSSARPIRRFGSNGVVREFNENAGRQQLLVEVSDFEAMPDGGAITATYSGRHLSFQRIDRLGEPVKGFGPRGTGKLSVDAGGLLYLPSTVGFPALSATGGLVASPDKRRFYFLTRDESGDSLVIAFDRLGRLLRRLGHHGIIRVGTQNSFRGTAISVLHDGTILVGGALTPPNSEHNLGALLALDHRGHRIRTIGHHGYFRFRKTMGWVTDIATHRNEIFIAGDNDFGKTDAGDLQSVVAKLRVDPLGKDARG